MPKKKFFNLLICWIISISIMALAGCGPKPESRLVVARINNYELLTTDFMEELRGRSPSDMDLIKSESGREQFLEDLIVKELLIQKAQQQGLDKDRDFMKTIERYWKQTLLKKLLERKSKEISGLVHVYDYEVEQYYLKMKEEKGVKGLAPLEGLSKEIRRSIRRQKETLELEKWIADLREKAKVIVNRDLLSEIEIE